MNFALHCYRLASFPCLTFDPKLIRRIDFVPGLDNGLQKLKIADEAKHYLVKTDSFSGVPQGTENDLGEDSVRVW